MKKQFQMIICAGCGHEKIASLANPEYCASCYLNLYENVMGRAEAARCLIDRTVMSAKEAKQLEIAAAVDIFFPWLSKNRRDKIFIEIGRLEVNRGGNTKQK